MIGWLRRIVIEFTCEFWGHKRTRLVYERDRVLTWHCGRCRRPWKEAD